VIDVTLPMVPLLLLELNELNFEFVEHYARQGSLPTFARLLEAHGYARTASESVYEHVEPWIQWFSVHTGKSYVEHRVFRLGDGPAAGVAQIWELLEKKGLRVGAFSPMNAGHALKDAAFFVPDPWTKTEVTAPPMMRAAYAAICQAVGDNAAGRITPASMLQLAAGLTAYARVRNWPAYLRDAAAGMRSHWPRAVFLDRFLGDCFLHLWRRSRPDFATAFMNGAAHLQHHYLFNSAAYRGPHRNPRWYLADGTDPLLAMYRVYDDLLSTLLALEPRPRLMIATGLHQDPVDEPVFYWRLRDHAGFLARLGCAFVSVEPRMSRDFLIRCRDAAEAAAVATRLGAGTSPEGSHLFEIDNRGETLFVTLAYAREIGPGFAATFGELKIDDLSGDVVFVAIKNGHHNGIGYFLDTGSRATPQAEPIPLTELCQRMVSAF